MANPWEELEEVQYNAFEEQPKQNKTKSPWDNLQPVQEQPSQTNDFGVDFGADDYNLDNNNKPFSEAYPIVASIPEATKQFGTRAVKSFPQFGVGINDLVALVGDKTGLQGLSDFGRSNAKFWQEQSDKIQIDPKYQGIAGLKNPATFLPTVAGSIGDQATNLLMAGGGGAGGAKLATQAGLNGLAKTGLITAGTSIPNVAQEGTYLDKIEQFQQINGRLPNEQEIKQIQNVAIGEKGINTALETVADRLLFGKLFPNGTITKGVKNIARSAGEQAVTEALTEGLQEGVSIGAEKALGINQGNNLQRLADSMAIGGITGGVTGGGATAISQPLDTQFAQNANNALKNVSAQILNNGKVLYNSANDTLNNAVNQPTEFDLMRQLSQQGTLSNPTIEEIAPKTLEKQNNNVKKWDINNLPKLTKEEAENTNAKLYKKLAPNTMAKQESNYAEENSPVQLDEEDKMLQDLSKKREENNSPESTNQSAQVGEMVDVEKKIAEPTTEKISEVDKDINVTSKNKKLTPKIAPNTSKKQELNAKIETSKKMLNDDKFIPTSQKEVLKQNLKGEEKEYFNGEVEKLVSTINNAPKMYETESIELNDKKPVLHYFGGNYDNYVFEIDKETGDMFGAVSFDGNDFELGYSNINDINLDPAINLDMNFDNNKTYGEILGARTSQKTSYNEDKKVTNNERPTEETTRTDKELRGTVEEIQVNGGTDVVNGRGNNIGLESERGRGLSQKDKEIIEKQYKNQHELNKAIEDYINNEEYRKYAGSVNTPQAVKDWLKKYAGAGGLEKQGAEGKGLLSEYYTPQNIVDKMWDLTAQYVNTDGAKVLEPSVGIGRFLENAPKNTSFDVVEMNPVSARITKILYPNANVQVGQFQERFIKDNKPVKSVNPEYDIVIGNPPYGEYSGLYKGMGEGKGYTRTEAYFINRGLDSLKENGIMTFIVPSSFLDSAKGKLEIANKAQLLDAYRLPENMFDTTSIGTDIIVLRKQTNKATELNLSNGNWFKKHPEKILGNVEERKNRFGKMEKYVKGDKNSVDSINTSKKDIKETVKNAEIKVKETAPKTVKKQSNKVAEKAIKVNVEYEEYKPEQVVSDEDYKYFKDTQIDGTLPKSKYSPNEKVNQYNGELYNDFNYLQGDIYKKLDALKSENISDKQKELQRKKLEKVLPEPLTSESINYEPTSDFIRSFQGDFGEKSQWTRYGYEKSKKTLADVYLDYVRNLSKIERGEVSVYDINKYINGERITFKRDIRVPDNIVGEEAIKKYKDVENRRLLSVLQNTVNKTFNNFIKDKLDVETRKKLEEHYNRTFNNIYNPDYSKLPMLIKGLNSKFYGKDLKLQNVQVEGVNFLTNKGAGLLGFEVGVGKTLTGIISTVQNMQMGRCKRPLILVPKQVKDNWIAEINEAFPNIKVNDVGNLSKFKGNIDEGSITVATYEALGNMWYEKGTEIELTDAIYNASIKEKYNATEREREKTKEQVESVLGKALGGNKQLHTVQNLGFDHITVDEAHNFKNLFEKAQSFNDDSNHYSDIQGGSQSTRACRLFLLTQHIMNNNNNRNVFLLTATPFNNNALEVFNMLSYTAKDVLDAKGLSNIYQFMENFAQTDSQWVVDSNNNVVYKQIVTGFKNAKALKEIINSTMLIRSAEDAGIVRPNKHVERVYLDPTPKQEKAIANAEALAVANKDDGDVLKAINQSRGATLSPDIASNNLDVTPEEFVENAPKIEYCLRAIESMSKNAPRTSQILYMPLGVKFLPKIKEYLVKKGVFKENEIEIIDSNVSDDKIPDVVDSFNAPDGKTKLIIGTRKIREGMNLNKNSSVLYVPYLDWNPTDFQQVVGRIWRRGNRYGDVRVVVPTLNNSSDSFMFQKNQEKSERINSLLSRDDSDYIDSGELNTIEDKINMITNPAKKAKMFVQFEAQKIDSEIASLEGKIESTRDFKNQLEDAQNKIKYLENNSDIEAYTNRLKELDKDSEDYKRIERYVKDKKEQLKNAKDDLKGIQNRIKRLELDLDGTDSVENLTKRIEEKKAKKENLKVIEENKLKEYQAQYEKEQKSKKTMEQHIQEFEDKTNQLYQGKTQKGGELYREREDIQQFIEDMNDPNLPDERDYIFYQRGVKPHPTKATKLITLGELVKHPAFKMWARKIVGIENMPIYLFSQKSLDDSSNVGASFVPFKNIIMITPNSPHWGLAHEIDHAIRAQKKENNKKLDYAIWANQLRRKLDKRAKNNPTLKNRLLSKIGYTIYRTSNFEMNAYHIEGVVKKDYERTRKKNLQRTNVQNEQRNRQSDRYQRYTDDSEGFENSLYRLNENTGNSTERGKRGYSSGNVRDEQIGDKSVRERDINTLNSTKIEQKIRDKVYEWHGNIGKDRYDVDKTLNSFVRNSKNIAKELSVKTGIKISDKQLREILPFLRERTSIPEKLDRDDLKNIYLSLNRDDLSRLTKFADDVSEKFEKYYKNYQEAKGVFDENTIENHISHIWDLDKNKKSLLTNYITTKSRFAKERTIETLAKGINGIEIDGETVYFKPKTLDYAEILKSSSDNLIKSTHDSILANEIKNLKYKGESLVKPLTKAPEDWIEVNHPALNKAVYIGSVGEEDLPMLMKTPVKVHPDIANYVNAVFETPTKQGAITKAYDTVNGMLKQTTLGFSGFHGYALTESALANAGIKNTLKALNIKKMYDAVKNGNYEVYEKESEAKKAIESGLQLGTPSDLNRNLVEDALNKIPVIGKYIGGAVSVNNKILWDVLHNNFKLMTYNAKIAELEKLGKVTKEQEREVAQWVNDSFGGQAWELLGIKQSSVQKAGRLLLSPDWNFSTIRQALGSVNSKGLDKWFNSVDIKALKRTANLMGISETMDGTGSRGKVAKGFWIRAVIYSTVFYNLLNAMFRDKDRKEHPERYPKNMTPFDYSIWANANPMDNWYDKLMPYVFIGRNSDGTARMLRVGKQFRELPELLADPISKLGGKSASILSLLSQVSIGMSVGDIPKKLTGRDAYLNQDIWNGYGEDATMRTGMDAITGRLKVAGKSAMPFIASKYVGGKHEPSAWDFVAQTSTGTSKGKVYKEVEKAYKEGKTDKIRDIKIKAYKDGLDKATINKMAGYAEKNYKVENTKIYKPQIVNAMKNNDKVTLNQIKKDMIKHKLTAKERQRIYDNAYKKYMEEKFGG